MPILKIGEAQKILLSPGAKYLKPIDIDYLETIVEREGGININWQPIATAPRDEELFLAVYVEPSPAAAANGSRALWCYGTGRFIYEGLFSGILTGKPSHYAKLNPPISK